MERSTLSWYWRIVSSSWRFIPPFIFGICSYLWKSLLPLNNNYWLFLKYCAWCITVYWCNSYTIVHFSLDIIEWFKYNLKFFWNCTRYWFTPLSVSTKLSLKTILSALTNLIPSHDITREFMPILTDPFSFTASTRFIRCFPNIKLMDFFSGLILCILS